MLEIGRRGFLTGLIAAIAAPAIVRAQSIMPVKIMRSDALAEVADRLQTIVEYLDGSGNWQSIGGVESLALDINLSPHLNGLEFTMDDALLRGRPNMYAPTLKLELLECPLRATSVDESGKLNLRVSDQFGDYLLNDAQIVCSETESSLDTRGAVNPTRHKLEFDVGEMIYPAARFNRG